MRGVGTVALALPLDREDRAEEDARRHSVEVVARAAAGDELAARLAALAPDLVLAAALPRYLTPRLLAECDRLGVRVVAVVASEAERRFAAGLGLLEAVDVDEEWPAALAAPLPAPAAGPGERGHGRVIAMWGTAGAPGRTSVAIAVAAELAAAGRRVALPDVDTHGAAIAPSLGLLDEAPGFAAACRLAASESLTLAELDRIAQWHDARAGAFRVLTGIGRPDRWPELTAERVAATLARCREWVEDVVLDLASSLEDDEEISSDVFAPRRNAATLTALAEADVVLAVAAADPVGIARFLRGAADLAETLGGTPSIAVVNKVRASAVGPDPHASVARTIERFGGIVDPVLVPYDRASFDAAVLSGATLPQVAPRSAARLALHRLVTERLLPRPARVPTRRRAWAPRPFARRGAHA